jgi:DNA-binding HxlR family transcriptional regulator
MKASYYFSSIRVSLTLFSKKTKERTLKESQNKGIAQKDVERTRRFRVFRVLSFVQRKKVVFPH